MTHTYNADGRLDVTLTEAVVAVDEGRVELPVCVDFLGSVLTRQVVVTLTTLTGSAQGSHNLQI